MARTERTFKVIENRNNGYCVLVYRNGKEKLYPNVPRRRIETIADCIRAGHFVTRPFTGGGLGYVAEEQDNGTYSRRLAQRLLDYWQRNSPNALGSPKIALIKHLRFWHNISLVDAKSAVETMFLFDDDGQPVIK